MIQATQRELKPRLRFPEFHDAGEWEEKRLEEMFDFQSTANNSRADLSNAGDTFYIHYGDIHTKFHQYIDFSKDTIPKIQSRLYRNATFLKNGDLVIADASEDTEGIAKAVEVRGLENGVNAISGLHTILLRDLRQNYVNGFKGLLREIETVKKQIKRLAVGAKVYSVSKTVLKQVLLPLPSHPEQQKIAECLSSIDELIASQTQKLVTLKTHKKGLIQQLFPAEGETQPKLRFPEFCNAGEWEEKDFGEICNFVRGPFGGSLKKEIFVKDGYAIYEQSHAIHQDFDSFRYYISEDKFNELKRFSVQPDDIIMSCSGTMGKFAIIPKEAKTGVINQALLKLTVKKQLDIKFIKAILELPSNQEQLLSQSAGGAIKNVVSVGQIKELIFCIPSLQEQQKIADSLSSIDELITAQTQKLGTLKIHKKGLMQQLFPAMEEASS